MTICFTPEEMLSIVRRLYTPPDGTTTAPKEWTIVAIKPRTIVVSLGRKSI